MSSDTSTSERLAHDKGISQEMYNVLVASDDLQDAVATIRATALADFVTADRLRQRVLESAFRVVDAATEAREKDAAALPLTVQASAPQSGESFLTELRALTDEDLKNAREKISLAGGLGYLDAFALLGEIHRLKNSIEPVAPTPPQRLTDVHPHPETLEHEGRTWEGMEKKKLSKADLPVLIIGAGSPNLIRELDWSENAEGYIYGAQDAGAALYRPVPEPQEPAAPFYEMLTQTDKSGIPEGNFDALPRHMNGKLVFIPEGSSAEIVVSAALSDDKAVG